MAEPIVGHSPVPPAGPGRPGWRAAGRRLLRHKGAVVGGLIVLTLVLTAVFAPVLAPYDPYEGNLLEARQPPSAAHPLGTDEQGRDVLSRIIHGSRLSLTVGVLSVAISLGTGLVLGALAAYYGGWWDLLVMRVVDVMLSFPTILLALAIVSILGPGLTQSMIAVGLVNMPIFARLVRSSVLSIKETEYIEAARAVGQGDLRIIVRHILPNCLAPLTVQTTLSLGTAILETAGLSFLGLGAQPPHPEWGAMLSNAQNYMQVAPWLVTYPGLAIIINVLGFNLLGDGLRDVLDPRLRGQR